MTENRARRPGAKPNCPYCTPKARRKISPTLTSGPPSRSRDSGGNPSFWHQARVESSRLHSDNPAHAEKILSSCGYGSGLRRRENRCRAVGGSSTVVQPLGAKGEAGPGTPFG